MKTKILIIIFLFWFFTCVSSWSSISSVSISGIRILTDTNLSDLTTIDMTSSSNYYDLIYSTSKTGYLETNSHSRGIFSTTALSLIVTAYSNIHSIFPNYDDIGVRVNGEDYQSLNFSSNGFQNFFINLPSGSKIVEIVSGAQTSSGTSNIYGSWPTQIVFNGDSSAIKSPPEQTKRIVILGDSISVGDDSTNPSLQAWPMLVRDAWYGIGSIINYSYGYRSLNDNCTSVLTCQALADIITSNFSGITNKYVYLQISTNDYGLNKWSADDFGTNYARLLDAIHSNDSNILIYAQTATTRGTETANSFGSTLAEYRTQITDSCNARSSYCTVVDGTTILSYPTDYADTVHPSESGQSVYANYIKSLLSIP